MSSMTFAINNTNGIQSDKFYAIELGCTIHAPSSDGAWHITDLMPIISGPYDSEEDAKWAMRELEVEEIVVGSRLIDMMLTGSLHGVEVAFMI